MCGIGLLCAVAFGGCASQAPQYSSPHKAMSSTRLAVAPMVIEIEDDGLPAQTPPPVRVRMMPDDPSEPFSPNYGRQPVARTPAESPLRTEAYAALPDDLPAAFR
jgi:hypothetical protein